MKPVAVAVVVDKVVALSRVGIDGAGQGNLGDRQRLADFGTVVSLQKVKVFPRVNRIFNRVSRRKTPMMTTRARVLENAATAKQPCFPTTTGHPLFIGIFPVPPPSSQVV